MERSEVPSADKNTPVAFSKLAMRLTQPRVLDRASASREEPNLSRFFLPLAFRILPTFVGEMSSGCREVVAFAFALAHGDLLNVSACFPMSGERSDGGGERKRALPRCGIAFDFRTVASAGRTRAEWGFDTCSQLRRSMNAYERLHIRATMCG